MISWVGLNSKAILKYIQSFAKILLFFHIMIIPELFLVRMIVKEILRTIFMFLIGIMYVIKCSMLCNYLFVVVKKITYDLSWVDN